MKVSKSWLQELIDCKLDTSKLVEQLTMVGLEVDNVQPVAPEFSGVVVGEVLTVIPHPNADKLFVCTVNAGTQANNLTIVCGAQNVRPQLKVAIALSGAKLPGNIVIKKAKLRDVESNGMLCSAKELGLVATNEGIHELPQNAPIGENLRQYLLLDDEILEIELTADRGDCLSMLGVAREIAAINRTTVKYPTSSQFEQAKDNLPVSVVAANACPHYAGRIIRGVNNHVVTPKWMSERLRHLGIEPINLLVDVTNYVMLELGQPLHAFDLTKIAGGIVVRYAQEGETLELLSGQKINLNTKQLVIADEHKCLALAGVMGGEASKVSLDTQDMFLESAFFMPEQISIQAQSLNLLTDSSHRYTHGVDYNLAMHALERATSLIVQLVGGTPSVPGEFIAEENLPGVKEIYLPRLALQEIIGINLPDEEIVTILSALGNKLQPNEDGWLVHVPSWRFFDLKVTEDIVTEIARIYGYQNIAEKQIMIPMGNTRGDCKQNELERVRFLLEDRGYREVITYSFIDKNSQKLLGGDREGLDIANPLSQEQSVMRTSLWPGLVSVLQYNIRRQVDRARIFEVGLCFQKKEQGLEQPLLLAGAVYGDFYAKQWDIAKGLQNDFYDLKNDLLAILQLFVDLNECEFVISKHPALHPRRSAQILIKNAPIGYIGELHPEVQMYFALEQTLNIFEIDLSLLNNKLSKGYKQFSMFPKIHRDLAVVIDQNISWQQIKQKIIEVAGEILHDVTLFDIYRSTDLGDNKQSIAIRLTFQSVDRTLRDEEVKVVLTKIVASLQNSFSATLRE